MPPDRLSGRISRLVVTGGGTGGHVVPAITLLEAAREEFGADILYVGTPGNLEDRLTRQRNIPFSGILTSGFMGKSPLEKLQAVSRIAPGVSEALRILKDFRPDLMVGTGGYVQVPSVLAAALLGVPVFLLEPNGVTGWANRLLKPFVSGVVLPYGDKAPSGIPLKSAIRPERPDEERFSGTLTLLVVGGSQGARQINRQVPGILKAVLEKEGPVLRIIHQAGEAGAEETRELYRTLGLEAEVLGFDPDLSGRYRTSSLVIARAGAMTVAEITYSGTPAFYVPYPRAIRDHQRINAEAIQRAGGGWVWPDGGLSDTAARAAELSAVLNAPDRLREAGKKAWSFSPGRPAAQWLLSLLDRGENER
ncbi:MAG: UDP-N-acetylglucosamine--N-acetylmuramyl-(pentapeptide) pyrophosphoryl-undecaprenol N-acetylglucosamine transferase [Nitrospirae bacterium]|jgi:UDP-N-acetylglucosamine--N-acetylmuramyl-(pentapeptide) pyrophosphoryl-undecaprenol N-acetylglucosamine transferase|nr:UDP-N-acetylglucosamine--N-acetylmuramyl-(pentapeptide) pyrophosphoryl-undecaprenol N-acetylglucosamine transferase [Nitrospirota bacterium]